MSNVTNSFGVVKQNCISTGSIKNLLVNILFGFIVKLRTRMGDHDEHSPPEVDERPLDKSQVFASCLCLSPCGWLQIAFRPFPLSEAKEWKGNSEPAQKN